MSRRNQQKRKAKKQKRQKDLGRKEVKRREHQSLETKTFAVQELPPDQESRMLEGDTKMSSRMLSQLMQSGMSLRVPGSDDHREWHLEEVQRALLEMGYAEDDQINVSFEATTEEADIHDAFTPNNDGSGTGSLDIRKLNPDQWRVCVNPPGHVSDIDQKRLNVLRDKMELKAVSPEEKAKLFKEHPDLPRIQYDPDTETPEDAIAKFTQQAPGVFTSPQGFDLEELQAKLPQLLQGVQQAAGGDVFTPEDGFGVRSPFSRLPDPNDPDLADSIAIVGSVDVHLADGKKPLYPYVELVERQAIPRLTDTLDIAFSEIGNGAVAMVIFEADRPETPLFIGVVEREKARLFSKLQKHWGYWFLRTSVGEPTSNETRRKTARHARVGMQPEMGQVYFDYQIANKRVFRLRTPIHTTIDSLVTGASQQNSDDWELSMASVIAMPDNGREYEQDEALTAAASQRKILEMLVGKMPWRLPDPHDQEEKKSHHRIVVDTFLDVCDRVRRMSLGGYDSDGRAISNENMQWYRLVWAWLRSARPYEFRTNTYAELHRTADMYTTEKIAGRTWQPSGVPLSEDEDIEEYMSLISDAGRMVPFPEELPFEVCYFGWGTGVSVRQLDTLRAIVEIGVKQKIYDGQLIAHLVTARGHVLGFFNVTLESGIGASLYVAELRSPDAGWRFPFSLTPWTILTTLREIEDHATVIDKTVVCGRTRRAFERFNKKHKLKKNPMLPPPFYTVYLRDKLVRDSMRKTIAQLPGRKYDYRHDVEGHDRLYYKKGVLPLGEKQQASLLKRGYSIYRHGDVIPADLYDMMMRRGRQPPSRDQWVALKKTRVDAHLSPSDPDLPYIPSVRKTTKGITSERGKERRVDWEIPNEQA